QALTTKKSLPTIFRKKFRSKRNFLRVLLVFWLGEFLVSGFVFKKFAFAKPMSDLFLCFRRVARCMDKIRDTDLIRICMRVAHMGIIATDSAWKSALWLSRTDKLANKRGSFNSFKHHSK